jgi:hypothetical protein
MKQKCLCVKVCAYVRGNVFLTSVPVIITLKALFSTSKQGREALFNQHKPVLEALLRHGQRICVFECPRCNKCILTDLCDYYNTVVKPPTKNREA